MSETPEEPEGGEPGPDEGSAGGPEGPDAPQRGWIDPEDRLWRHPSEVSVPGAAAPAVLNPPPRHPYRGAVMVLVGVVAVMAVAAWIVVLLSPASQRPLGRGSGTTGNTLAGPSLTTLAGTQNTVPASAEAAGHSMVELLATTPHGTVALIGVAVAEGGLVATVADPLGAARRLVMVGAGGKPEPAQVVATDHASDVALVNVPEDLPVAPFADDTSLGGGSPDLTLSYTAAGSSLALHCTPGAVVGVGSAIASGPADGMPSITSSAAAPALAAGEPLLDAAGSVVGVLYDPDPGNGSPVTFLPSGLVVGVADELRSSDRVVHGWLGITGADAANGGGARVEKVQSGSPAAGRIDTGQVIVALDGVPVRTMAELVGRLYVLPPGSSVALSVQQGSSTTVVDITLSGSS